MKEKIRLAALALEGMILDLDEVEAGSLVAARRFRRRVREITRLMEEIRNESKLYITPNPPSPNGTPRMEPTDLRPTEDA